MDGNSNTAIPLSIGLNFGKLIEHMYASPELILVRNRRRNDRGISESLRDSFPVGQLMAHQLFSTWFLTCYRINPQLNSGARFKHNSTKQRLNKFKA